MEDYPINHVPFPPNNSFAGREDVLRDLKNRLFEQSKPRVALVGLGGMGKTQVALQLAYWVMRNRQPCSVIWLPALSMAGFKKACADVIHKLGISNTDNRDSKELLQRYLCSHESKCWLLIVDNVDDMEVLYGCSDDEKGIHDFLPWSDDGRILFTTRLQEVAVNVAGSDVQELQQMSHEDATMLLEQALIHKDQLHQLLDKELLRELLEKLACLPLALAQAAAYINIERVDLSDYVEIFNNTSQDAIELLSNKIRNSTLYHSSQGAAATTWIISFKQIQEKNPLAAQLLSFISWIEPKGIPKGILPNLEPKQRAAHAIGTLCGYRFLERRGKEDIFDMHSLVHLATREWSKVQGPKEMAPKAVFHHLGAIFKTDAWEERDVWRMYLPHVLRALDAEKGDNLEECILVGYWAGRCLRQDGRTKEALRWFEHVVAIAERLLPPDHPDILISQHDLAIVYLSHGKFKAAIELLEHAVKVRNVLAEDHPNRLASQHELARAYEADGRTKEAIKLLEHIVTIEEQSLLEDHPDRLASQHALAGAYEADGRTKEAIKLLEHIVTIEEQSLLEDHPDRLASQHALARAYEADGRVKKAVKLLEHVVAIKEQLLSEDHPDRLASQHELARMCYLNGQTEEGIQLMEQVVRIEKTTLGADHPNYIVSERYLDTMYGHSGQHSIDEAR